MSIEKLVDNTAHQMITVLTANGLKLYEIKNQFSSVSPQDVELLLTCAEIDPEGTNKSVASAMEGVGMTPGPSLSQGMRTADMLGISMNELLVRLVERIQELCG